MEDFTIIYSKSAIEFVTVAKEFLLFIDKAKESNKNNFIDKSLKILPLLYLKAILLPHIDEIEDDFTEKFVDEASWSYVQQVTSAKLGEDDDYVQIQDLGTQSSLDSLNVSLSEIYADMFQEIGDFIGAYRTTNDYTIKSALFYCSHNFENYWGIRLLSLMKALHQIKYSNKDNSIE